MSRISKTIPNQRLQPTPPHGVPGPLRWEIKTPQWIKKPGGHSGELDVAAELSKRGIPNALLPENFSDDDLLAATKAGKRICFIPGTEGLSSMRRPAKGIRMADPVSSERIDVSLLSALFIAGLLATVSVGLIVALSAPREPMWDGQPLSDWLQIGYGSGMTHGETDQDDADAALRHIGTAALPFLVHELGATHSHIRWRLVQLLQRQSILSVSYRYPDERRARAVGAFQALGGIAAPALPEIRRYLSDPELRSDAQSAIDAIREIGGGDSHDDEDGDAAQSAPRD